MIIWPLSWLAFWVLFGCCYDDCCEAWVVLRKNPAAARKTPAAERRRSTGVFSGSRLFLHRSVALEEEEKEEASSTSSAAADGAPAVGVATKSPPLSLLDVASSITQESCTLLGIKSLGVDYGLVRTGLAVTVGYQPVPLAILEQPTNTTSTSNGSTTSKNATVLEQTSCRNNAIQQVCSSVVAYAQTQQVDRIIVGLPLHKNGTVAEQTNLTLAFGSQLVRTALATLGPRVSVHFFDERYTSKEAAARAHSRNPHTQLYGTLDADAACIILENYYEDDGVGAHTLELPEDVRRSCLEQFERRQRREEQQRRAVQEEREAKVRRRKEAMAAARALEEEERAANQDAAGAGRTGNKAKRKKKKRKR